MGVLCISAVGRKGGESPAPGARTEAWGHVVARLLLDLPFAPPADLVEKAKVLDNFYMPTRYANGHPRALLSSITGQSK